MHDREGTQQGWQPASESFQQVYNSTAALELDEIINTCIDERQLVWNR